MKKNLFLIFAICLQTILVSGQSKEPATSAAKVNSMQPIIMVIPRVKEGEDIRKVLDDDFNRRLGVSKLKEAFDSKGFKTKSFEATLKKAMDDHLFTSENQSDMKSMILEMSVADIYVEVDVSPLSNVGGRYGITVLLEGSDCSTGTSYANKSSESGYFNTTDIPLLLTRAIDKCKEEFLNTLQTSFTDIVENGRPLSVSFKLAPGSTWNFDKEINGTPFSDVIDAWMAETAVKNNYNPMPAGNLMVSYEIHVPLKDEKQKNYTPKNFALKIYNWLKTLNIPCQKEIKNGTIYITIK